MLNAFQKLVSKKAEISSYELIRLQAKTHRGLKNKFGNILDKHNLSTLDWSILGILFENKEGCHYNKIATDLAVEPPFITELVTKLIKLKLINIKEDITDRRAKKIFITPKGEGLVEEVEAKFQEYFSTFFKNVTASEFDTFKKIMEELSKNE